MKRIMTSFVLALFAVAACSDSNGPDDSPAGAWHATRLIGTDNGTPIDGLAVGVTIAIALAPDGTTSGTLHTPAALSETGLDENESLAGTWAFDADSSHISFDQAADTFIHDGPWAYNGSTMTYSATGPGDQFEATLTRN